jgi:hypothetical protein
MCQNENDGFQAIWPSTRYAEWDPPKFADYKTSGASAESLFCSHPHPRYARMDQTRYSN